ncbi:MAG: hypothetical protein AB4050_05070 [Synechococcus sp.]
MPISWCYLNEQRDEYTLGFADGIRRDGARWGDEISIAAQTVNGGQDGCERKSKGG